MLRICLVISLIALVLGQVDPSQYGPNNLPHIKDCNIPCVLKFIEQVCVYDGTRFNVYNDECELQKSNCEYGNKLITVSMDKCLQSRAGNAFFDFCKFPCPNIERPICAKIKNGQAKLFKNQCIMGREACSNAVRYTKVDMSMCKQGDIDNEECSRVCPLIYEPKCGFNGEDYAIFGNDCDMDVANCLHSNSWSPIRLAVCYQKLGYELDLPTADRKREIINEHLKFNTAEDDIDDNIDNEKEDKCPKVCKREFFPVCAFDGKKYKIFSNECLFKKEKCETNIELSKAKMNSCMMA